VYLTKEVLPKIKVELYNRALCLLDPYGLHLDWEVMFQAGQSKAIDIFLNFPVMDMNRNAIWRAPENAPKDVIDRMNRFWGDESWHEAAYAESDQGNLAQLALTEIHQ
jgi:three-Cys-motif partner protein